MGCGASKTQPDRDDPGSPGHSDKHGHSHHSTGGQSDKHGHSHHSTDGHSDKHGHSHHHADATDLILKTQSGVTSNHAGHDVNDILRPKHGEAASEKLSKIDQLFTNPHLHDDGSFYAVNNRRTTD